MKILKSFPFIKLNLGIKTKIDKDTKAVGEQLKDWYVAWKFQYNRGMGYYDLIKQPTMVFAGLKILGIPFWALFIFVPLWIVGWPIVGWLDRYRWKLWQKEAEWGARKINPFEQEVLKRLKNTEKIVGELRKSKSK